MKTIIAILAFTIWSGTVIAESDCLSPMVYAGRDYDNQSVEHAFVSYGYNTICSGKSTKAGLDFDSSTTAIVDVLPIKSHKSLTLRKDRAEQFCKEQSDYYDMHRTASRTSSIVVRESLNAFIICKAMEAAKVRMNFDIGTRGFAIKVARGSADANFEGLVVSPAKAAVCSMTHIGADGGSFVEVGPATVFPLTGREVTITCEKNIQDGRIPGVEAEIKTSEKSMRLTLFPDFEYIPQYASQMRENMEVRDKEYQKAFDQQNQRTNSIGTYRSEKPAPIVMTGGAGWDKLEKCPAGYYVAGVGARGGGGGKYCYNCVETVKFICEPFYPPAAATDKK